MRLLLLIGLSLYFGFTLPAQQTPAANPTAKPTVKKANCSVLVSWEGDHAVKVYVGKKEVDLDARDTQTVKVAQGSYHLKVETLNKTIYAEDLLVLKPGRSYLNLSVKNDTLKFIKETDAQRKQRLDMEAGQQKMAKVHADSLKNQMLTKEKYDSIQNIKTAKEREDSAGRQMAILKQKELEQLGIGKTIKIGDDVWTTVNLNVSKFRNGDIIPEAKTADDWKNAENAGTPAWCYLKYDLANGWKYGKFYNWYAVHDARGLAPAGWHIPTNDDWATMITNLGGDGEAGKKIKNNAGWDGDGNGSNSSGFSALPAGKCASGDFANCGKNCYFWSATKGNFYYSWARMLGYDSPAVSSSLENNSSGFNCRCVKDN